MSTEIINEPDARRYVMRIDDQLVAVLDYAINDSSISLTRAFTSPPFRGKGHAAEVMEFAVDDIEKNSTRAVIPMCQYAGEWFDSHPERAALLTRSV